MHKLRWIEYYKSSPGSNDAWAQKEFYIDLSDVKNYTTTAEIVNEINQDSPTPRKCLRARTTAQATNSATRPR